MSRKKRIYWKQAAALGLGLTFLLGQTAYGAVVIPPFASVQQEQLQQGSASQSTQSTPDQTETQNTSAVVQSGESQAALPSVSSEGAVLIDARTGKVLFGKNEHQQFYPASITKVMTALLVLERCSLDSIVTFSASATTNLESGAVSLGISEGDQLTVEQSLYGLLLKSANEIGNGLAEYTAGSVAAFADLMNARAKELGCQNTHFVNPHGLNDAEHKTTPYDMALIMRAAAEREDFRKIDSTTSYSFPATKQAAARTITMGHKMMYPSDSRYYEGIIGGKTGYTSKAGNTLVTAAERDGVRLIAVVMKANGTHYADTKAMLDYGFRNYQSLMGGQNSVSGSEVQSTPSVGQESAKGPGQAAGVLGAPTQNSGQEGAKGPGERVSGPSGQAAGALGTPTVEAGQSTGTSGTPTVEGGQSAGTSGASAVGAWRQENGRWRYRKADKTDAANCWEQVGEYWYWFDADGYMAEGWRRFSNGAYYYFMPGHGRMVTDQWIEDGAFYYLGSDGVLMTNTTTPDGHRVDENGIRIS